MISDLYPPKKPTSAMATFVVGANIGVLLAFLIGGVAGEFLGWRWALVIAGVPGLVLALLMWLKVREPARPDPIPFFGELGSVNPMFLLPHAMAGRTEQIASGWAGSLTMGAGQFCTNPGIAIVLDGPDADSFTRATQAALSDVSSQTMLTAGMAEAFASGKDTIASQKGVKEVLAMGCAERQASPFLYEVSGDDWLANHQLGEEVFGPLGLIVRVKDTDQMIAIAKSLQGQLTATLHMDDQDSELGQVLMPILTRKAGRILANGFPTGVEVSDAMVHGGPYPASTNFGATSVGTMAIRRWLRPVCFQAIPNNLLPQDLI